MAHEPDFLQTLWFVLIAILWVGYFILEGFDFGVGMLVPLLGRDEAEKRALIHTIGPLWDGNEVWLIVAGGATFAAFPGWYASLFSGFYLALLLILLALIVRGVAFEFWGKIDSPRWRALWEGALAGGSALASFLWGVAFANIIAGVPLNGAHNFTGTIFSLLHPYALLGGLASLLLFLAHGAAFLTLRTRGELRERAGRVATPVSIAVIAPLAGFLLWSALDQRVGGVKASATALAALAVALAAAAPALLARGRQAGAFGATTGAIAALFAAQLVWLFPLALPSSTARALSLTLRAASSSHYTLTVMSIVAVVLLPVVLLYQGWTYWIFRYRLSSEDFAQPPTPGALIERAFGAGGTGPGSPAAGEAGAGGGGTGGGP